MLLSVVIPAYNEEETVERTAAVTGSLLRRAGIAHELIFVDDGSKDRTWEKILSLGSGGPESALETGAAVIRGIHFSRNFGKEAAILAGLARAAGDCCVVIDCDLQHPPEKIIEMYRLWEAGYEVVEGRKTSRGEEGRLHGLFARCFYAIISRTAGFDMENSSDFKLLDRRAVDALLQMREQNTFFRALSSWIGFKTAYVSFDVQERAAGATKWTAFSLVRYALRNIAAFSAVPMQIVTGCGVVMLMISAVFGGIALVQKFSGRALEGFTTVILILLLSSSIIMISLGIIGYYIARIYEEVKARPRYIISSYYESGREGADKGACAWQNGRQKL